MTAPVPPQPTLQQALALHQAGNLAQAEALYRQILANNPNHFDALHLLGILAFQTGHQQAAVDLISKALAIRPNDAAAHVHMANAFHALRRLDDALRHSTRARELAPQQINANIIHGAILTDLGRLQDAAAVWKRLIQLQPNSAIHHSNLGTTYERMGRLDEAIASSRRAVQLDPNYPHAHNNLGAALNKIGKTAEAIACHQKAVKLNPNFADAWLNLANCFQDVGDYARARAAAERGVALNPNNPRAYRHLGSAAEDAGLVDEAAAAYDRAIALYESQPPTAESLQWLPRLKVLRAIGLPPVYRSMEDLTTRRAQLESSLRALKDQHVTIPLDFESAPTLFNLAYHGQNDRPIAELFTSLIVPPPSPPLPPRTNTGKIRIGFISRFFRNHTIGRLNHGLIAQLDRSQFHVTVFSVGDPTDDLAREIKSHADTYIPLPTLLPTARQIVQQHPQDILFYTDLGMEPITYGLAFSRLAPVQCVTWGHPVTTAIPTIDHFISTDILDPAGNEQHYTENLVRLKNLAVYYHRPILPSPARTRRDFDLPEEAHLYGCLQMLWKFHPEFDEPLAEILRRDPKGRLILIHGLNLHWDELLLDRFRRTMPGVIDRVLFLPRQNYENFLALTSLCDVSLDPTHFGGGNTTYEALAFDVPVITLPSRYLRGRLTLAMYDAMQLTDCVATSIEDYVNRAVAIATDKDRAAYIRKKIREHSPILYQNPAAVRELEIFFRSIL